MSIRKVKLTGDRSIASKLHRLAYELEYDAKRIRDDHNKDYLADSIRELSSRCGKLARAMEAGE